jgi:hypothetical protein
MFLPIEFQDEQGPYIEHLNVTHITRISFVNPRNPDAGSKIHLRTGEVLKTTMPFDLLSQEIDEAWESASTLILSTMLSEKAKLLKKSDLQNEEIQELPPLSEV